VDSFGDFLCFTVVAPWIDEVGSAAHAADPDVGFDRTAEGIGFQNLGGLHPPGCAGALVAHLGEKFGAGCNSFANEPEFIKLVNERLLTVDMLAVLQGCYHHGAVVMVRSVDDDGIELIYFVGESLAVVGHSEIAVTVVIFDPLEHRLVGVAESRELDFGMSFQPFALHAADTSCSDLENAELAVLVRRGADGDSIGCKNACAKCSGGLEEITAGIVLGSGFAHEVTVENARLRIQFDSRRICGKENRYIEFGIIDDIHLVTGLSHLLSPSLATIWSREVNVGGKVVTLNNNDREVFGRFAGGRRDERAPR